MKDKKKLAIIGLVLSIACWVPMLAVGNNMSIGVTITLVCVLMAIAGIVLGAMSVKASKGVAIAAIVIGAISTIVLLITMLGYAAINNATNCVDKGDGSGVAVCEYAGQQVEVPVDFLRDDQIKQE